MLVDVQEAAAALTAGDYPISPGWLRELIRRGEGPPHERVKHSIRLNLNDAWQWANARPLDMTKAALAKLARSAYTEQRSDGFASPVRDVTDLELLADHLALHIRDNHPREWVRFRRLQGQARRDRLNQLTAEMVQFVLARMRAHDACDVLKEMVA